MPDLTHEVLAELKRLDEAASPAPWVARVDEVGVCETHDDSKANGVDNRDGVLLNETCPHDFDRHVANSDLVAEMRNRIHALIAAAEENARLRESVAGLWQKVLRADEEATSLRAQRDSAEQNTARLRQLIDDLFQSAHRPGCLWLDRKDMPCQCGAAAREWEVIRRVREAQRSWNSPYTETSMHQRPK